MRFLTRLLQEPATHAVHFAALVAIVVLVAWQLNCCQLAHVMFVTADAFGVYFMDLSHARVVKR